MLPAALNLVGGLTAAAGPFVGPPRASALDRLDGGPILLGTAEREGFAALGKRCAAFSQEPHPQDDQAPAGQWTGTQE